VVDGGISAITLGGLSGGQSLGLTNHNGSGLTLTVGNNNSTTYSGNLNDFGLNGGLTKAGTGTLTLSGTNSYNLATTISAGVLRINTNGVLNTLSASVPSVAGAGLVVSGGTLTVTNASTIGNPSAGLLVSSGSATFLNSLSVNSAANGAYIDVTGGSLTMASLTLGRTGLSDTAQPTAGSTGDGLYINGGAVNILGNLNMGTASAANSSVSTRIDSGSLTVGGAVYIGLNNGGRWSVLDVNGGSLMVTDVVTGISIGNAQAGDAELLIRNGTVNAGIIGLGYGTVADTVVLNQTNGSLYVGAGGIVQVSTNATASITLAGGLLGATTNWSCTNNIQLTGTSYTIQTADASGNPENIYLGGTLSGTGALIKTGQGTLVLSNADICTGSITVSNGVLVLVPGGSITNTAQVSIASNATFDVSALTGYTFSGASPVQTLAGISTSGTANVNATGNTLTLASGANGLFKAAGGAGPTVGKISVAGNLALNGNVITINVTGSPLGVTTNRLLDCTGTLSGTANATPVITGLGLNPGATASIVTTPGSNGHVDLVVTGSMLVPTVPPHIAGFNMVNTNLVLNGTNGQTGGTYYLLGSTNLALPLSQWTPVATNVVSTNGANGAFTFTGTNTVHSGVGQQYYILSNTNN
jgi:autotransporter-associated beta strand protein